MGLRLGCFADSGLVILALCVSLSVCFAISAARFWPSGSCAVPRLVLVQTRPCRLSFPLGLACGHPRVAVRRLVSLVPESARSRRDPARLLLCCCVLVSVGSRLGAVASLFGLAVVAALFSVSSAPSPASRLGSWCWALLSGRARFPVCVGSLSLISVLGGLSPLSLSSSSLCCLRSSIACLGTLHPRLSPGSTQGSRTADPTPPARMALT